jgi:glycine dehydrogenase
MRVDKFSDRHIGPREAEVEEMLQAIGAGSLDELVRMTIPGSILSPEKFQFEEGVSEAAYLDEITEISKKNKIFRSFIGQGLHPRQ